MEQTYDLEDLTLKLKLIFGTNRTALIETSIINKTEENLELNLSWDGHLFTYYTNQNNDMGTSLTQRDNGVKVDFETIRSIWNYRCV